MFVVVVCMWRLWKDFESRCGKEFKKPWEVKNGKVPVLLNERCSDFSNFGTFEFSIWSVTQRGGVLKFEI